MLGVKTTQDPVTQDITLSQAAYCERVLCTYDFWSLNPTSTPLLLGIGLERIPYPLPPSDHLYMSDKPYREVLSSMMWAGSSTRPDISFAVSYLARFQDNPGKVHWLTLVHLCRYIRGTLEMTITYQGPRPDDDEDLGMGVKPYMYSDADYGGCLDTRRSTSGYIAIIASGPVSWASKRQQCVTTSTTGAEYVALGKAAEQAVWMTGFLSEIDLHQSGPITIRGDNLASISIAEKSNHHQLIKHIDIRHHFIRELVANKSIFCDAIPGAKNPADILTKPLSEDVLHRHLRCLHMLSS